MIFIFMLNVFVKFFCQLVVSFLEWVLGVVVQVQLGYFLVKQVYLLGYVFDQVMGDLWVVLYKVEELFFGNYYYCVGFVGDYCGVVFFVSEYGYGVEDFVFLYIVDFLVVYQCFGMFFDDDEYMICIVVLVDQCFVCGEVVEVGGWVDFWLFQVCQCIVEQGSLFDQVL